MSMTQKYPNDVVYSPGTVIISASGEVADIRKVVEPVIENNPEKPLIWIDFSFCNHQLGGSAFAQSINKVGTEAPTVADPVKFVKTFNAVQELVEKGLLAAGHDIGSGGLITTLLEMCFADNQSGSISTSPESGSRILFVCCSARIRE
jgi:phosphoribosylformylglycinamidine synthase